ncbi:hypothetical protein EHS25_000928 [Saitozyma podzolica]|uniref:Carrier domain-containing protein n=1 Tax=Saitozyma podzolica TaxID=1890683 RepID=A0A427YXM4_9TREE|nr:hypothetical protein EHS25_000928 [Saitozyma podzolica]
MPAPKNDDMMMGTLSRPNHWFYASLGESLVDSRYVEFEPYDGALHHMIVRPGYHSLSKANRPDGAYESGDLLVPHQSRAGLWKYIGGVDDMIVHSTGLKTNPVPMEKQLEAGGFIKEAMVVGNGKQCAGLLGILSDNSPRDALQKMLALLDQVNACAPSHSRIVPELVKILPKGSAFEHTVKRTLRRRYTVDKYAGEIEAMYGQYDGPAVGAQAVLQSQKEAVDILEEVLDEVFPRVQGQQMDADFFDLGMNSLNATRLRNALQRRLAFRPPLKATVVFEHPTKDLLASFLWTRCAGGGRPAEDDQVDMALQMLKSAKGSLKRGEEDARAVDGDTVLLTGATGALGTHTLVQLLRLPHAPSVVCLIRAISDKEAESRVDASLAHRRLPRLVDLRRIGARITCLCTIGEILAHDIFVVLHVGWPVNFNYSLRSFTAPIQATVDLLNAFPSARHLLISSVSAVSATSRSPIPEIVSTDVLTAEPMGYSRSKWITEQLFSFAADKGWSTGIARAGLIVGDTAHGVWNGDEACSLILRSFRTLKVLPNRDVAGSIISWLPVDHAAWAISRLARLISDKKCCDVWNLAARPQPYSSVLAWIAQDDSLPACEVVEYHTWISVLQKSIENEDDEPAAKLLGFFNSRNSAAGHDGLRLSTKKLRKTLVRTLHAEGLDDAVGEVERRLSGMDQGLLKRVFDTWREDGLF